MQNSKYFYYHSKKVTGKLKVRVLSFAYVRKIQLEGLQIINYEYHTYFIEFFSSFFMSAYVSSYSFHCGIKTELTIVATTTIIAIIMIKNY